MHVGQIIRYKIDDRTSPDFWGVWCVILEIEENMFIYRTMGHYPFVHVRWVEDSEPDRFLYDW